MWPSTPKDRVHYISFKELIDSKSDNKLLIVIFLRRRTLDKGTDGDPTALRGVAAVAATEIPS